MLKYQKYIERELLTKQMKLIIQLCKGVRITDLTVQSFSRFDLLEQTRFLEGEDKNGNKNRVMEDTMIQGTEKKELEKETEKQCLE